MVAISSSDMFGRALAMKSTQKVSAALRVINIVGLFIMGEHTVERRSLLLCRQYPGDPLIVENCGVSFSTHFSNFFVRSSEGVAPPSIS